MTSTSKRNVLWGEQCQNDQFLQDFCSLFPMMSLGGCAFLIHQCKLWLGLLAHWPFWVFFSCLSLWGLSQTLRRLLDRFSHAANDSDGEKHHYWRLQLETATWRPVGRTKKPIGSMRQHFCWGLVKMMAKTICRRMGGWLKGEARGSRGREFICLFVFWSMCSWYVQQNSGWCKTSSASDTWLPSLLAVE